MMSNTLETSDSEYEKEQLYEDEQTTLQKESFEVKEVPLSKTDIAEGLSQLSRTADGISHAFVRLEIKEKQITEISAISLFVHLRYIDLSKNNIRALKPLQNLEHLVAINFESNAIEGIDFGASTFHALYTYTS